ncbi:hypothetical protein GCM10022221_57580 [Actinocorallia aurea]
MTDNGLKQGERATDVKARVREGADQVRETAHEVGAAVHEKAARLKSGAQDGYATAKTRTEDAADRVRDPGNAAKVKAGGVAVAGAAALGVAAWAVRRSRRPRTRWDRSVLASRRAFDRAIGYGRAVLARR